MWNFTTQQCSDGSAYKVRIEADGNILGRGDFLDLLSCSAEFRDRFTAVLLANDFAALRWETPPLSTASLDRPFECAVIDSPYIDLPADRGPFAAQFDDSSAGQVIEFRNLGGDALMVVPCPVHKSSAYSHLRVFLDCAPVDQVHALWRSTAGAALSLVSDKPIWLNTAGGGVAWLHVRLDRAPKYYHHAPYCELDA